jgi:hypothetical protein
MFHLTISKEWQQQVLNGVMKRSVNSGAARNWFPFDAE